MRFRTWQEGASIHRRQIINSRPLHPGTAPCAREARIGSVVHRSTWVNLATCRRHGTHARNATRTLVMEVTTFWLFTSHTCIQSASGQPKIQLVSFQPLYCSSTEVLDGIPNQSNLHPSDAIIGLDQTLLPEPPREMMPGKRNDFHSGCNY